MIKEFKYEGISIYIKTNILKDGEPYFGEKNIDNEITVAMREIKYKRPDISIPNMLIRLYNDLAATGIKVHRIECGIYLYEGNRMTELTKE